MYKCICGYKASSRYTMEQHMRTCSAVKTKMRSSSDYNYNDSLITTAALASIMDSCYSYDSSSSYSGYSSSSSDYSGGGGSYDGGGASDSW